ncbi:DUF6940 family protein [Gimesia panareensis]|uniref:Uncharacterized protein n=1 Tax=Gimesia panareensis TaxID=2527978 RepID=A0A517Q796_9PLAN|nr:hypothetical protein [Gimesia panareensis]QDT27501.1 hypothetical protein Enr10x_28180 [Gimesia panareensis]QDU49667.1 hypothetical protein Pan110_20060 [Gimesia panareensis]
MWDVKRDPLADSQKIRFLLEENAQSLSFADVLERWRECPDFSLWFSQQLAELPFTAFRWETPAVTASTVSRLFEFVVIDSPALVRQADRTAFTEHFSSAAPESVVSFSNLRGDAILVVPCPSHSAVDYCHLADFVRGASELQQQELWKTVGTVMQARLNEQPVWLSTAGAGVAWLHVRLDDRPKYYGHQPYRSERV